MRGTEDGEGDRRDDRQHIDEDDGQIHGQHHCSGAHRDSAYDSDPDQHPIPADTVCHSRREGGNQSRGDHPDQRDDADRGGPPVPEGHDTEGDDQSPLGCVGGAEGQLCAAKVRAAQVRRERRATHGQTPSDRTDHGQSGSAGPLHSATVTTSSTPAAPRRPSLHERPEARVRGPGHGRDMARHGVRRSSLRTSAPSPPTARGNRRR